MLMSWYSLMDIFVATESLSEALHPAQAAAVLEVVDGAVDACIDVQGGISSQYFYRSMYAVQLHHCFKVGRILHCGC